MITCFILFVLSSVITIVGTRILHITSTCSDDEMTAFIEPFILIIVLMLTLMLIVSS